MPPPKQVVSKVLKRVMIARTVFKPNDGGYVAYKKANHAHAVKGRVGGGQSPATSPGDGKSRRAPRRVRRDSVSRACTRLGPGRGGFGAACSLVSRRMGKAGEVDRKEFKQENSLTQQTGSTQVRTGAC